MPKRLSLFRCEVLEDRLTPAGGLDPTFGSGGIAVLPPELSSNLFRAAAAAVVPDGKIVVAGTVQSPASAGQNPNADFAVARLTADGKMDTSFAGTGFARVPFDLSGPTGGNSDEAFGVAVQPDGRVVVVGSADTAPLGNAAPTAIAAARLTATGQLDPSFGNGGRVVVQFAADTPHEAVATAVAIQSDGRIVLAGSDASGPQGTGNNPPTSMAAVRLTPAGQLDATFGGTGKVLVPFPVGSNNVAAASAVAVQPDGKIVLAGSVAASSGLAGDMKNIVNSYDFAATRLTNAGQLDSGFGDAGRVRISFGPDGSNSFTGARAVGVLGSGQIVAAGAAGSGYASARLTPDGELDPTYDGDGRARGTAGLTSFTPDRVVVAPDGRVVFAAVVGNGLGGTKVVRLTADGQPDAGFVADLPMVYVGGSGAVTTQPDGSVVLAGTRPSASEGVVARLLGQPAAFPVPSGSVFAGGSADGSAWVLFPDGGQLDTSGAVGFFPGFPGTVRTALADVNGDGVPDLIGGAGPGGGPNVVVFDGKSGAKLADFFPFEKTFTGGVFVAAADLNGDGKAEVVATPDQGGGPVVAVYDGAKLTAGMNEAAQLARFLGIDDPNFRGGARPALGDVSGDGAADLLVSAGFLGGPRVALYDGKTVISSTPVKLMPDFFAFEPSLRNGAFVAAGDVTGDGTADVAFGGGPGGAPRVRLIDGRGLLAAGPVSNLDDVASAQLANFFAGDTASRGGVRLALRDTDGDGKADLVAGSGEGEPAQVRVYKSATLLGSANPSPDQTLDPFGGAPLANGVFVG